MIIICDGINLYLAVCMVPMGSTYQLLCLVKAGYEANLVSVCLSTAPEQMSCMSSGTHSSVVASLTQIEPSMDPTRLRRSFNAAYSIVLLCSSLGKPSWWEERWTQRTCNHTFCVVHPGYMYMQPLYTLIKGIGAQCKDALK